MRIEFDSFNKTVVCQNSLDLKDSRLPKLDWVYTEAIYPVDDCLNKFAYGIAVLLRFKKADFDNIPDGQSHYDDFIVNIHNTPDGMLLFNKVKPKTLSKKYAKIAIDWLCNEYKDLKRPYTIIKDRVIYKG